MARSATLTTCYEYTELRDGSRQMLKLWLLMPRCGDGERRFLGVASAMGAVGVVDVINAQEAEARARRAGYEKLDVRPSMAVER